MRFNTDTRSKSNIDSIPSSAFLLFFDIEIVGGTNTPYEGGVFTLEINVPER